MAGEDQGWAGSWEPMIVDGDVLQKLRDVVGQSKLTRKGEIQFMCRVNLQTGEVKY